MDIFVEKHKLKWNPDKIGVILVVCGKPDNPIEKVQRIIGGSTAQPGSFPWQAKTVMSGLGRAGGALLGDRWILTAAHTLYPKGRAEYGPRQSLEEMAEKVEVFLGAINVTELHKLGNKPILRLFVHPDYNPDNEQNFDGDIALIELRDPVTLGRDVLPICLPDPQNTSFYGRGRVGYASGFGRRRYRLHQAGTKGIKRGEGRRLKVTPQSPPCPLTIPTIPTVGTRAGRQAGALARSAQCGRDWLGLPEAAQPGAEQSATG
ncbi:PREDICTED: complement C1r subcomponent-like, partial [Gekko japonicus]|uniref:Complement C1r subcomponent-like n=1 Tax=Gekko japonicus TaxID=146911 RepID=A0ABM1JKA7_GEKJA